MRIEDARVGLSELGIDNPSQGTVAFYMLYGCENLINLRKCAFNFVSICYDLYGKPKVGTFQEDVEYKANEIALRAVKAYEMLNEMRTRGEIVDFNVANLRFDDEGTLEKKLREAYEKQRKTQ